MRKVVVFNHVSLDGFFVDASGNMGFAHKDPADAEWNEFVAGNASGGGMLLFGRVTYDMMAAFWPTPAAAQMMPEVAAGMNNLPKVVFSRTLKAPAWQNTSLAPGDLGDAVRRLKREAPDDMTILGSGTIVSQLTALGLIDEFHLVINPVVLGAGRTLFEGVSTPVALRLMDTRQFANGSVFSRYAPAP